MSRWTCLVFALGLLLAAPAAAEDTLPLESLVPDAAEIHVTDSGFAFLSTAATDILATMDLEQMLLDLNPIYELGCTNLLIMYVQMEANISEVNLENLGVEIDTTPLMGLDYVTNAIYLRLWMAPPNSGEPMIGMTFTGLQGSSGCTDPLNATAELDIDPLEIGASVTIEYDPAADGLVVTLHQVLVNMGTVTVTTTGFPAGLDDWVELLLTSLMPDLIEGLAPDLINQLLEEQLGDLVLEGEQAVGDYTLHYGFFPEFTANEQGLSATTDGSLYILGDTIDPCLGGTWDGSPYTDNPLPDFGALTPGGNTYHFGLALSDDILNQLLFSFLAKGELCLMFPWELTLGDLEGMLPGWQAPVKYEDASNLIDLYPLDLPRFVVGEGEADLALVAQPYRLDWYIQKENRYVVMLSAEIDLNLALSMETDAQNNLIITLTGTDITFEVWGSEFNIIPENMIETVINGIIDFALPLIMDLIPPIPLPNMLGYQFAIHEIGALGDGNDYFGLYCEFLEPAAKGPAAAFRLPALGLVTNRRLDAAASARAGLAGTPYPRLALATLNGAAVDHFLVRLDGGAWQRVEGDGFDLSLLLEGRHVVETLAVSPRGLVSRTPARLSFLLDRVAPRFDQVRLSPELVLTVGAHDHLADAATLRYQVRVPGNEWSAPFTATTVQLALPAGVRAVDVRAIDPAGNTTAPRRVTARVAAPAVQPLRR